MAKYFFFLHQNSFSGEDDERERGAQREREVDRKREGERERRSVHFTRFGVVVEMHANVLGGAKNSKRS